MGISTMGEAAFKLESVPMPQFSSDPANKFRSIQGEQQEASEATALMAQEEVDKWIETVDERILECRERGRHAFPTTRQTGLRFSGVDEETGLMIRRIVCPCCGLAERVELWDVQHRGNKVTRCEFVSSTVSYHVEYLKDGTARKYTAPSGHGRMYAKQVRNAVATGMLGGQSFTRLVKDARAAQRERD